MVRGAYPLDQSTYYACQIAYVTTVIQANFTLPMQHQRREALDDLKVYFIKMVTETVLADDAEGRDGGSNG
jgi:predicted secreted Zn-dependent protease